MPSQFQLCPFICELNIKCLGHTKTQLNNRNSENSVCFSSMAKWNSVSLYQMCYRLFYDLLMRGYLLLNNRDHKNTGVFNL